MLLSIRLKSDGTATKNDIQKKIDFLKERFKLGYNNIYTMQSELKKITDYIDESIYLTEAEKNELKNMVGNLENELPGLNKERNLPYNKSINTIKLLEEDFLEDSFWKATPEELERSYLRVLNILNNSTDLNAKEKVMLKEFVSQKIAEIPQLAERREREEAEYEENKKVAIASAKERYEKQSFFTKVKQFLITKESPNKIEDDFEFMSIDSINDLYTTKKR